MHIPTVRNVSNVKSSHRFFGIIRHRKAPETTGARLPWLVRACYEKGKNKEMSLYLSMMGPLGPKFRLDFVVSFYIDDAPYQLSKRTKPLKKFAPHL